MPVTIAFVDAFTHLTQRPEEIISHPRYGPYPAQGPHVRGFVQDEARANATRTGQRQRGGLITHLLELVDLRVRREHDRRGLGGGCWCWCGHSSRCGDGRAGRGGRRRRCAAIWGRRGQPGLRGQRGVQRCARVWPVRLCCVCWGGVWRRRWGGCSGRCWRWCRCGSGGGGCLGTRSRDALRLLHELVPAHVYARVLLLDLPRKVLNVSRSTTRVSSRARVAGIPTESGEKTLLTGEGAAGRSGRDSPSPRSP